VLSATADCISLPVGGCATGIELPSAPASIPPMVRTLPPGFGGVIDAPVLTPDGDPTADAPAADEDPRIPPGKGPGTEEPPKDTVPTDPGASTTTVPAGAQELLPCGPDVATVAFVPCATTTTVPATTDTVPGEASAPPNPFAPASWISWWERRVRCRVDRRTAPARDAAGKSWKRILEKCAAGDGPALDSASADCASADGTAAGGR